jgi:hypothetical protein
MLKLLNATSVSVHCTLDNDPRSQVCATEETTMKLGLYLFGFNIN